MKRELRHARRDIAELERANAELARKLQTRGEDDEGSRGDHHKVCFVESQMCLEMQPIWPFDFQTTLEPRITEREEEESIEDAEVEEDEEDEKKPETPKTPPRREEKPHVDSQRSPPGKEV